MGAKEMAEKKQEGERRFRERLRERLDLSADLFEGSFVELRGRGSVTVRGGGRILLYTPTKIRIAMSGFVLSILGERLVCTSYYRGAVGVDGKILGISFEEGEE